MWKCTCCEKENPDMADNCEECGHVRFMDYIHHRTLSRIPSSMEVNWKADQQTEKQSSKPVLMAYVNTNKVFGKNILRESIQEIEFVKVGETLKPYGAWDISADQNKTIWAWTENAENKMLLLKIGSEDGIYANTSCAHLFEGYSNTTKIVFHDLFDTSLVTNMRSMFCKCRRLKKLDGSKFNTALVTDMRQMFCGCRNLEEVNVSGFDTSKVTNMSQMFCGCRNLKEVDVSSFDISKVTDAQRMFESCRILEKPSMSDLNFKERTLVQGMFRDSGLTDMFPDELNGPRKKKKTLKILNSEELKKRKHDRTYQGNSIEEICRNFLSYKENRNTDTGKKDNIIKTLKVLSSEKIYLIHDDSWFKRGKNGFAITDKGIHIHEVLGTAIFVSWEKFQEYEEISGYLRAGKKGKCRAIAYITGTEEMLQVEMLLIAIHEYLNQ